VRVAIMLRLPEIPARYPVIAIASAVMQYSAIQIVNGMRL
jgi:hypothetical protein